MKKAYIKLHIALLLAGFTGIFGRLITLNEGLLSWYRLLISAIGMFLFLIVTGRMSAVNNKGKLHIAVAGALLGFHWLFFYGSIKYANISVGVVCFALTSFFNAVMAPLINKKKFSAAELLLSSLTLLGISLIFGLDAGYRTGIILGIISSTFGALYTIYNERLVQKFTSEMIILYQMFGGLAALTLVMPLFLMISPAKSLLPSITDFGWLLVLSLLCTLLLYFLITGALRHISSFTVSLTFNLEPLYTILLAILIYKENKVLSIGFYAGLMLIVISVILQMYRVAFRPKAVPTKAN